jgi:hypothetical protein
MAGALTGGFLNLWRHGRKMVMPGAVTATLFCSALQIGYNELVLARLRMLAQPRTVHVGVLSKRRQEPSTPFLETVVKNLGFDRMSDEQYLAVMRKTRDDHLRRISELEEQIERERQ